MWPYDSGYRKSLYTPEIAKAICERLAAGESLRAICRDEGMPSEVTVREWVIDNREGFYAPYTRAREIQAMGWADEILSIADDAAADWVARREGKKELNSEHVARSRMRLDTRKWLLSKMLPKVYGDKLQHANAAGDGNAEIVYRWKTEDDAG